MALDGPVDLGALATESDGFTGAALASRVRTEARGPNLELQFLRPFLFHAGADIAAVCSEAAHLALREDSAAERVSERHLLAALRSARPSIGKEALEQYAKFGRRKTRDKTKTEAEAAAFALSASVGATGKLASPPPTYVWS